MKPYRLKSEDLHLINEAFEMSGGFVLDFSNRTFQEFFALDFNIDIYNDRYAAEGNSKANRLRHFIKTESPKLNANVIVTLWKRRMRLPDREKKPELEQQLKSLVARLRGKKSTRQKPKKRSSPSEKFTISKSDATKLKSEYAKLLNLDAHPRGFAFEKFLKDIFEAYRLAPRGSFRLVGEQIDGSFEYQGDTYLLEAKWQNNKIGSSDLRAFDGKVTDKSTWARGIFISYTGYSREGLLSFGKGKSIVCLDGLDLFETLQNGLNFTDMLRAKIRAVSETGVPFEPVANLRQKYPSYFSS